MGLRQTHKQKFKMKSIYKTKKRRRLMQVEHKWCGKLSRDNLKHKLYTTRKLFKRKHHSPPYGILYDSPRELHPNGIFFLGLPKSRLILSQGFGHAFLLKSIFWSMQGHYTMAFKRIFRTMYCMP
jgi:hypothetical protein